MGPKCDIGIIGMAVMGQNLALNMEGSGYKIAVYNRTTSRMEKFVEERAADKNVKPTYSLQELVDSLKKPRRVMLMVKAGKPVDIVIDKVNPLLEEGDIIIDGGNSHYKDTERRYKELENQGIKYIGTGISGGEYGALHGPSIMPGGDREAYKKIKEIFEDMAATAEDGPCVTYLGPRSSGHYVKMVHNGIEYGVMEVISEIYDIMRKFIGLDPERMSEIFSNWNQEHKSYLIKITSEILQEEDPKTAEPLIDVILDKARQKGTGKWTVQDALDLGIPIPTIGAAVEARLLSALKEERLNIAEEFEDLSLEAVKIEKNETLDIMKDALYVGIVTAYAEGMKLMQVASKEYEYNLDLSEIASIWKDGCIVRSSLLKPIQQAYGENENLVNLIVSPQFKDKIGEKAKGLRKLVTLMKKVGIPLPALDSALDYYDSLRSENLPANMIQAQRDYFGAHAYERKDKEGSFHTEWQDIHNID